MSRCKDTHKEEGGEGTSNKRAQEGRRIKFGFQKNASKKMREVLTTRKGTRDNGHSGTLTHTSAARLLPAAATSGCLFSLAGRASNRRVRCSWRHTSGRGTDSVTTCHEEGGERGGA